MNRLPLELHRLYGLSPSLMDGPTAEGVGDAGFQRGIRAAVLAVVLPAGLGTTFAGLARRPVGSGSPCARNRRIGTPALQLWFSFASPISSPTGSHFFQGLHARYLPGGQATILRALEPIRQVAFEAALDKLGAFKNTLPLEPAASERVGAAAAKSAGHQEQPLGVMMSVTQR